MSKFDKKFVGLVKSKIGTSLIISACTLFAIWIVIDIIQHI